MAGLDRGLIVAAALELLDEVGLEHLSTRRLAERLGVRSPALYWHFASKRALVDAMAEAMLDAADWPDPGSAPADPADWLADRARALRGALLAHRDGALVHSGTRPGADALPIVEAQTAALVRVGFTAPDALRTTLAVSRYTVGWVLEEQAEGGESAEAFAAAADDPRLPTLTQARSVVLERDPDRDFEFGLQALIAGAMASAGVSVTPS